MEDRYEVGNTVVDIEEENPNEAVVVRKTDMRISEWEVENGTTVHDDNPEYDEDEDTVLVVYTDYLDEEWPEWQETDPEDLYEEVMNREHISWYSFPESRLVPVMRYFPEEYATLNEEGTEKYGDLFVVERLPLRHIINQQGEAEDPETGEEREIDTFAVDFEKLLPEERKKLSEFLKDKFDESDEEFEEHLEKMSYTVPVRSKFVSGATSQQPFKYM